MIDSTLGGIMRTKTPEHINLFKSMAMNSYQWNLIRVKQSKIAGIYDVDAVTALATQVQAMNKKLDWLALIN